MKNIHAISLVISGKVQRVGFRWWIKRQADRRGITGWVRNNEDGSVEAYLQGNKEKVEELTNQCRLGPPSSQVESVEIEFKKGTEDYRDFRIIT